MRFICPLLVVKDMERSKAFYQTVLHRRVLADLGANVKSRSLNSSVISCFLRYSGVTSR